MKILLLLILIIVIVGLIVGAVSVLTIVGMIILRALPIFIVLGGVIVWLFGNKSIGDVMIVSGLVGFFIWEYHIDKKPNCNCIIHKIRNFIGD